MWVVRPRPAEIVGPRSACARVCAGALETGPGLRPGRRWAEPGDWHLRGAAV